MNYIDENTLKQFADLARQFLAEYDEYEATHLWQHLENERKLHDRLTALLPFIEPILAHS